jgi:hypothetical protein
MPISRLILVATLAVPVACGAAAQERIVEATPIVVVQAASEGVAPDEPDLAELLWVARPLVVFADSPNDPRYAQQIAMLDAGRSDLDDRRVVVLVDTDPAANGPLRRALRPRGFGLVLIDTDGSVIQRRPSPTTVRELSGTIDRLPSRREETGSRRP